jgi:hypothetical protein
VCEQPELLEVADVVPEWLEGELGERIPAPQVERSTEQARPLRGLLPDRLGAQVLELRRSSESPFTSRRYDRVGSVRSKLWPVGPSAFRTAEIVF